MSSTIPVYSHNPWDLVYSPWQLDFQQIASEDNPTGQDGRIPKLWVAFLGEKTAISCIFRLTKGGDTPFVRRRMQDLAIIFPSIKPYPQFGKAPGQDNQISIDQLKRISLVALSFASLYSPVGRAISLCMDLLNGILSMKSLSSGTDNKARALLDLTLAVVSVSGTIFKHRIGLAIAAGQEALLNSYALRSSLWTGDVGLAIENTLYLANNSLYIAALFYCSLEIVFFSLVLQVLVQMCKAYGEFEKGNNLGGFAHFVMGVIRSVQIYSLGEILLVKWFIKADVEIWKENLSPQENAVKETLGMKYLYFKKGDKREKFLILSAQSDYNHAFEPNRGAFLKNTIKLNERFDVKFRTISRAEDIKAEIELAAQAGKVTGLLLRAHGNPDSMEFGSDPASGDLWRSAFPTGFFSKLDPECVICLDSCETAKDPDSIAYVIASESQRVTYAPNSVTHNMRLSSLNPVAWRFFGSRGVKITKIITPNPLSDLSNVEQMKIPIPNPRTYTT